MIAHGQGRCSCKISTALLLLKSSQRQAQHVQDACYLFDICCCDGCTLRCFSRPPALQQVQLRGVSTPLLLTALHLGRSMHLPKAHRWTLTQRYEGAPHIKGRGDRLAVAAGGRTHVWERVGCRGPCKTREGSLANCSGRGPMGGGWLQGPVYMKGREVG